MPIEEELIQLKLIEGVDNTYHRLKISMSNWAKCHWICLLIYITKRVDKKFNSTEKKRVNCWHTHDKENPNIVIIKTNQNEKCTWHLDNDTKYVKRKIICASLKRKI